MNTKTQIILSIIVPSFNSAEFLEATLKTIADGVDPRVEYLFIDGGSTDKTMEIFGRYAQFFSACVSEKDKGQSDAINKGFRLARGKFVSWVNADDLMNTRALPNVLEFLESTEGDWVTANTVYLDQHGKIVRCCRAGGFEDIPVRLGLLNVFGPSTFVSKLAFSRVGDFDLNFHYCMDADYWWRMVKAGYRFQRIPVYFWGLRLHHGAKTASVILANVMPEGMRAESLSIRKRFYPFGSLKVRMLGLFIARVLRILNLSLPIAMLHTRRFKGMDFKAVTFR